MKLIRSIVSIFLGSVLSFFFLSFLVLLVSSLFLITRTKFSWVNDINSKQTELYRHFEVNTLTNTTSVGFVSLFEKLDEYEYKSYYDYESYYLISNFGEPEYQCSGSCFCKEEEENYRRYSITTTTFRNGIFYLMTAASTLIAYNLAKEYFDEECRSQLSDLCSYPNKIESIVDSCEDFDDQHYEHQLDEGIFDRTPEEKLLEKEKLEQKEMQDQQIRRYFCIGNCKAKKFKKKEPRELAKEFDCPNLVTEGLIEVSTREVTRDSDLNNLAKLKFLKDILNPYCKMNSVGEYIYENKNHVYNIRVQTVFFCIGGPKFPNQSLKCNARRDFRKFNIPPPVSSKKNNGKKRNGNGQEE